MAGKFNPFQSKQAEVLRWHQVGSRKKALKLYEKLERKRPFLWVELESSDGPLAEQKLEGLTGETSVALFIHHVPAPDRPISPPIDALVTRLWKHFNKLHLIALSEPADDNLAVDNK